MGRSHLSAIGRFGLQVVERDELSQQAALLVAALDAAELEVGLRLEEDEPQVDGEAGHVDAEGPVGIEDRLPAVHLPGRVDLGRLVAQPPHEGHGPHGDLPSRPHLPSGVGVGGSGGGINEEAKKRN